MTRVGIRRNVQVALEGVQLPGNVAVLFGVKGSPNIDEIISEGDVRLFSRRGNRVSRGTGSNKPIQRHGGKRM